jgi:type IV pilus assembly protein PilY1
VTDGLPTSDANNHYGTAFTDTMAGFIDGDGDFTDDVAAKLFATDLRPTVAGVQNAVTYTVGFSLDSPLLEHAATRGDGQYYSSNDATELGNALTAAVTDILLRNATLTAANVPASRSAFGDGFYTAYFSPGGRSSLWPGHLQAFTVNSSLVVVDAGGQPAIDPVTDLFYEPRNPHWDLADNLIAGYTTRKIYTTQANARAVFKALDPNDPNNATNGITAADLGVTLAEEFQYPQDPNQPDFTTAQQLADSIVKFVHGYDAFDTDDDGSYTDVRSFVLGDIFHSNPIAVGPPLPYMRFEAGFGPASDVNSFMGTYGRRDRVMYVGANDGMLHAVAAGSFADPNTSVQGDEYYTSGSGNELFGYIPAGVMSKVKLLPKLDTGKQYFVDGAASASDVWIDYNGNGTKEGSDWTTTLLTPLREGGESLLALDVTNPAATSGNHGPYPRFMWEFTNAKLGQTWSRPIITRVKLRASVGTGDRCGANNGDGDCVEQWVAIFGAGYRPEGDPNLSAYTNNPASPTYTTKGRGVFMVNIQTGAVIASLAQDPNSTTFAKMRYAIPAEPSVLDLNFDGFADVMYIGDLGGQLWKWDLSAIGVQVAGVVSNTTWPAGVVFEAPVATTAGSVLHYHSIFQSAAAAYNNRVLTLSFASGERANLGYRGQSDPNDPNSLVGLYDDNNRFWVLKDRTPTGAGAFPATLPIYEQPLPPATVPATGHGSLTDATAATSDPNTTDEGYFFRVKDGEKFMTNHLIFGGNVATVSYTPDSLNSIPPGTCALGGKTFEWAWKLDDATAALDDPAVVGQVVRSRVIGNGAATDPRISVSKDQNGRIVVRITAQTSMGEVTNPDGGGLSLDPVDMIYWRQNF